MQPPAASARTASRGSRTLRWGLPLLALLVIGGMWLVLVHSLDADQERIEQDALTRAAGLARGYSEYTERSLEQIDQLTRFVAYSYLRDGVQGDLIDVVRQQLAAQAGLSVLSIADANGQLVASSQRDFSGGSVADRDYFNLHRATPGTAMQLSEPVVGRLSKRLVILLSRRLEGPNGEFRGVVVVSADPAYFADFYSESGFGRQGDLALASQDGKVRVRRAGNTVQYGGQTGMVASTNGAAQGVLRSVSDVDGRDRYFGFRKLARFPLVVFAGLDRAELLAPHLQRKAALERIFTAASVALFFAFGVLGFLVERLRRSQGGTADANQRFEAASDASLDAFFIFSAVRDAAGQLVDFRYEHCNARGAALLGLPKSDIVGRLRSEIAPANTDMRFFALYRDVLERRQAQQAEFTSDRPRLVDMVLQHQVVPVGDGVAITTRDLTTLRAREAAMAQTQEALRASEQRVRTITDHLPALISHIDTDERYYFVSRHVEQVMGVSAKDIVGRTMGEVLGPGVYAALKPHIQSALAGETVTFENEGRALGGMRAFASTFIPDRDPDTGRVRGFYALTFDITERRDAADALARSEQNMRVLTDNLPAIVAYVDAQARCTFANQQVEALVGQPPASIIGRTIAEVMGPAYDTVAPHLEAALRGVPVQFARDVVMGGEMRHLYTHYIPDQRPDGSVAGAFGMTFDVTELVQARLQIAAQERRLHAITDNLPAMVSHVDANGCYTFANALLAAKFNMAPADFVGRSVRSVRGEHDFKILAPYVARVMAGETVAFEKTGSPERQESDRFFQANLVPDRDENGVVRGYYAMTHDITERKRDELRLAASEQRIRTITDAIPAFVSHVDKTLHYTFVNARVRELHHAQDMVGRYLPELRGAEDFRKVEPYIRRALAGESLTFEKLSDTTREDGERHYQVSYIPDVDATGEVAGYYAMTFDITEHKLAEQRLAASEARVRAITENIPAYISHVDRDLRYTFVNANASQQNRIPLAIGKSMREVRSEAEFAVIAPYVERVLAGEAVTFEKAGDASRGRSDREFEISYVPDFDATGAVCGFYGLTFDITLRKRAERAVAASRAQLHQVLDNVPAMVAHFDRQEQCLFANAKVLQMVGIQRGEEARFDMRSGMGDRLYAQHAPYLPRVLSGTPARFPVTTRLDGRDLFYQGYLVPDFAGDGSVVGFYMITFNVTALKEAELRQAESEARLRGITDNLPALISYIDRDERLTFANAAFAGTFVQVPPATLLGRHVREVLGDTLYRFRTPLIARALAGERVEFDHDDEMGGQYRASHTVYVPDTVADGTTRGIFALSFDITALKTIERKLVELARVDALTGLPNRLAFNENLPQALARMRRAGDAVALMFLDIDHFKTINDTLGHQAGDTVLAEFARRLLTCVRSTDGVARLAGDEFIVVLERLGGRELAAAVAQKIVIQISQPPFLVEGRALDVTTSIGIVYHHADDPVATSQDLLARADAALYGAKAAGRNTFEFFAGPGQTVGTAMASSLAPL